MNQYLLLRSRDNPSQTALGRVDTAQGVLLPTRKLREGVGHPSAQQGTALPARPPAQ